VVDFRRRRSAELAVRLEVQPAAETFGQGKPYDTDASDTHRSWGPLPVRAAAARRVILGDPSLDVIGRSEIVCAALWPKRGSGTDVDTPQKTGKSHNGHPK
jgi:hypothetical protein